ncbi:hypothetical protein [Paraglaciecola sp.]|uniref:hypothetical protein n=1 Tax=Paraglaciecola sp. TaxID=1920173 RepID=UPI003EF34973
MKQFVLGVILALVGALASWIFAQYKLQDATGYIEYVSWDRSSYVQLEDELFSKIKFQYKDDKSNSWNDIPNISVATIQFENSSKKHLDDIDVIFEMNVEKDKKYSLIGVAAQGPEGYDKKYINRLTKLSSNSVGFNFDTINISSDNPEDHFSVTFLFAGDVVPEITPKVVKKGVKIQPLDRSSELTAYKVMFLVVYLGTIFFFIWWAITSGKKNSKRYQEEFDSNLKVYLNDIRDHGIPEEEDFVAELNKIKKDSGKQESFIKNIIKKVVDWAHS